MGPSHKDLPPFARRVLRPWSGDQGTLVSAEHCPLPAHPVQGAGTPASLPSRLESWGWGRTRAAVWLSEPPHNLRHVDPTGPEGRDQPLRPQTGDQQVGALGLLSPRPAQHAHLGPEGPLSPWWAPHPVHTLPWPHPRTRSGPREPVVTELRDQHSPWQTGAAPREAAAAAEAAAGPAQVGGRGWRPEPSTPWLLLGWREERRDAGAG